MANQEIKYYTMGNNFNIRELSENIRKIMEESGCEAQICTLSETNLIVQCRNDANTSGWLRKLSGTSKALSVNLSINSPYLAVQVGQTPWADKAVGFALSYFLFFPLALSATYGIYKQSELKTKILTCIDVYTKQQGILNY